ncbi:MAG: hypothetical protein ACRETO_00260 [Gammaproteobacteria bacterium]
MNAYLGSTQVWRPDRRASLSLALVSALLALGGFVLLLRQPDLSSSRPDAVSILLHPALPQRKRAHQTRTRHSHKIPAAPIPSINKTAPFERHQETLDLSIPVQSNYSATFLLPKTAPSDQNLQRRLNKPSKPITALLNNQGYRSEYGETVIKSGNQCGRIHTIQMSPSPTNKATIGFLMPCPGEYQPTLGEQLLEWAGKQAKADRPPS